MKLRIALFLLLASPATAFVPHALPFVGSNTRLLMADTASSPTVTRLPNSAVEVEIPVPGSATKAAYNKVCTELSKNIQVPGFRKGSRIPPQVLEQAMSAKGGRNAIKVQAINELLGQLVEPALKEQNLDPIGQATLKIPAEELAETFKPGTDLTLSVRCDVWPEIEWAKVEGKEKPYLGLKGKYSRKPFDQSKMDTALRDLKERYATLEPITDASHELKMGDACTVNMEGFMAKEDGTKGEPLPNAASGDKVEVVLGDGRYMEGLVEGLVGGKVGETKQVTVTFPEKLRDKTLAGKKAVFDVEIVEAATRTVPEITDEFAAKVKPGLTKDSLMAELRKAIDEEDAKEFVPARNAALGKALAEVMGVQVPDTLVTNQAREKFAVMMADMRDNGVADEEIKRQISPENFNKYKDIVKDDIVRDFKVSMATDEIARLESISVPDYQVEEQMQAIKKDAGDSEEFDENMILAKVRTTLERQAVMDWLAEQAELEVEYEEEEFDEALLEQLADQTVEREKDLTPEVEASKPEAAKEEVPVVEKEPVVEEKVDKEPVAEVSAPEEKVEKEPVAKKSAPEEKVEKEPVAKEPAAEEKVEKEPVVEEPSAKEPAVKAAAPENTENMSLEDMAFQALVGAGAVELHDDPNAEDYDHSNDNEVAK